MGNNLSMWRLNDVTTIIICESNHIIIIYVCQFDSILKEIRKDEKIFQYKIRKSYTANHCFWNAEIRIFQRV